MYNYLLFSFPFTPLIKINYHNHFRTKDMFFTDKDLQMFSCVISSFEIECIMCQTYQIMS